MIGNFFEFGRHLYKNCVDWLSLIVHCLSLLYSSLNIRCICKVFLHFHWRIQDFPYGGHQPRRGGGADSQGGYVSKILYVETKESGPLGGMRWACPLDLSMTSFIDIVTLRCVAAGVLKTREMHESQMMH